MTDRQLPGAEVARDDARDPTVPRVSAILEEKLPEQFGEFPGAVPSHLGLPRSPTRSRSRPPVADFADQPPWAWTRRPGHVGARLGAPSTGQSVLEVTAGPGVRRPDPDPGGGPGRCWPGTRRTSSATCWRRDGSGMCQLLPLLGRTAERRAYSSSGSRLLSAGLAGDAETRSWAFALLPSMGAVRQVARHRLPLAPRRGPALGPLLGGAAAAPRTRQGEDALDRRVCRVLLGVQRELAAATRRPQVRGDSLLRAGPTARWTGRCATGAAGTASPTRTSRRLPPLVAAASSGRGRTPRTCWSSPGRRAALAGGLSNPRLAPGKAGDDADVRAPARDSGHVGRRGTSPGGR